MYEMWQWVVKEQDGKEGAVAALIPGQPELGPMVLQGRTERIARQMEQLAAMHAISSGLPVRLVHLREVDE